MKTVSKILLASFSLLGCACAGLPLPEANLGGVNAPKKEFQYYWLPTDFTTEGVRKPEAQLKRMPINSLQDLNGFICTDPKGWEAMLAWRKMAQSRTKCEVIQ